MKKEEKKVPDEQVLFPEVKVMAKYMNGKEEEFEVKPWSFGELVDINPLLEEIFKQMESRGTSVDLENFNLSTIKNIYFSAVPQLGKIISKTLAIDEKSLSGMSVDSVLNIALSIFSANKNSLSNFFALFFGQMPGLEEVEEKKE